MVLAVKLGTEETLIMHKTYYRKVEIMALFRSHSKNIYEAYCVFVLRGVTDQDQDRQGHCPLGAYRHIELILHIKT